MIFYKKILLSIMLCLSFLYFVYAKPPNQLIFISKPPLYTKNEIKEFEKKYGFTFSKFAKKIYKNKIDIKEITFCCDTFNEILLIENFINYANFPEYSEHYIYKDGKILTVKTPFVFEKMFGFPTKTATVFSVGTKNYRYYIDENCIWCESLKHKNVYLFQIK
ncbi:hypothetical protein FACS189465_2890 [Clostridia bacterium]|nr:hypothetical protein FACS189465_2890 [Clostridia bacterium]